MHIQVYVDAHAATLSVGLGQIFFDLAHYSRTSFSNFYPIIQEKITCYSWQKLAVSGMTQCNSPTDHGINLPIQFKFVFNSTVQFLHCTYMYLYITLTPFATLIDHLTWQVFYFEHTLRMRSTSLSSFEAHYSTSARSCLLFKKLFPNVWPRPNCQWSLLFAVLWPAFFCLVCRLLDRLSLKITY